MPPAAGGDVDWKGEHVKLSERYRELRRKFEQCQDEYRKLQNKYEHCVENIYRYDRAAKQRRKEQLERYQNFEDALDDIIENRKHERRVRFREEEEEEEEDFSPKQKRQKHMKNE